MKKRIRFSNYSFIAMGLFILFSNSCNKDSNESTSTVSDIDGNIYHTVNIGTQVWMLENLKATKYNDNTTITSITDNNAWSALTTPGYCWYDNNLTANKNIYGALYNWHTVNSVSNGGKNVCPIGWHIPTDAEWTTLTTYLGGTDVAIKKLKEIGTTHWITSDGATNESGFTALPGGFRGGSGTFVGIGYNSNWWSSTESSVPLAWNISLYSNVVRNSSYKYFGFSVRCLKDN